MSSKICSKIYKNLWIIKKLHVPLPNGLRGNCAIGGSHGPLYLELCPLDDGAVNDDQVWIRFGFLSKMLK